MARGGAKAMGSMSIHTRTTFCRRCGNTFQGRPEMVNALIRLHIRKCSGAAEPVSMAVAIDIISPQLSQRRHPEYIASTPVVTAVDTSIRRSSKLILPPTGGSIRRGTRQGGA